MALICSSITATRAGGVARQEAAQVQRPPRWSARARHRARIGAEIERGSVRKPSAARASTSAALMSAAACVDVVVFDPKTTEPPITAAIAPIIAIESNLIAP